jgi:hypothetical protein
MLIMIQQLVVTHSITQRTLLVPWQKLLVRRMYFTLLTGQAPRWYCNLALLKHSDKGGGCGDDDYGRWKIDDG